MALEEESKKKCQSTIDYCTQPNTARLLDRKESRVAILAKIKLDLKGMLLAAPPGFAERNQDLIKKISDVLDSGLSSLEKAHISAVVALFGHPVKLANTVASHAASIGVDLVSECDESVKIMNQTAKGFLSDSYSGDRRLR